MKFSKSKAFTFNFQSIAIFYLCSSFLFLFTLPTHALTYNPVDHISIACGTSGNHTSSLDSETWMGDMDSKLFSTEEQQNKFSIPAKANSQSSSTPQVPYTTARLSRFPFTYSFPVTAGPKFLRLYFYPDSYQDFGRSKAYFSVHSGPYTLLKNFNASVTADADPRDTISREYCINIDEGQRLNLTFTPNSTFPNTYAFINGIQIVSMPTDLYFSNSSDGLKLIGQSDSYRVESSSAIETTYRLNVGGNTISPKGDTGMLRNWEKDQDHVVQLQAGSLPQILDESIVRYSAQNPNYTAPVNVYTTARSMGINATKNMEYNLTWSLSVDSGFHYMLRLHFCEVSPQVVAVGDRVFKIYLGDEIVEESADIIKWSGGHAIAIHRDYAIFVPLTGNEKKVSIFLKLGAYGPQWVTRHSDALLNGLELFKINDSNGNLGGENPDPPPIIQTPPRSELPNSTPSQKRNTHVIGIVAGVVSGMLVLSLLAFFVFRRGRKAKSSGSASDHEESKGDASPFVSIKSAKSRGGSNLPSDLCRYFSIGEIRAATNDLDEIFIIGKGGFGNVYKGYIDDGTTPVAIKRLTPGSQQGAHEFRTEIEMLSRLRHLHLVSLIGYCNDGNEMILVYDFMSGGTLRKHLYNSDNPPLSWKHRLVISTGAARGLHYLHTGAKEVIIHRDVKTTNILLDDKWVAKVSDFGLSRIGPTGMSRTHISTIVKGSVGYLDPEYYKRQRLSEKSDVYSFGVVLFEILCARPPLIRTGEKKQVALADWAKLCYHKGTLDQIVDPNLIGKIAPECLNKFAEIAVNCLLDDGTQRPSMQDVVWGLEFALQLQESAEERMNGIGVGTWSSPGIGVGDSSAEDSDPMFSSINSISGIAMRSVTISNSTYSGSKDIDDSKASERLKSKNIFSQLLDPEAR